ncbi:MAG: 16S rRNA (cytosine(1402)-N(4))-methyltransferase RsmH [Planctomycetota bacterium]
MAPAQDDLSHDRRPRTIHRPVLVGEVLTHLFEGVTPGPSRLVVDATLGLGGHAEAMLRAHAEVRVLGLDRDGEALSLAQERLRPFGGRVRVVHASYAELERVLAEAGEEAAFGVLFDLGASSLQFDDPARGFSFRQGREGADMRFDRQSDGPTALDLVNRLDERRLADLVHSLGDEPRSRAVARALVRARPIRDGAHLAQVVRRAALRTGRHDPATRTFQALRMAVNDELGHLERGLGAALSVLEPGGRLVVLSFHSGEDRVVKQALREAARAGRGRVRTKKPQRPTDEEVRSNPRARPARLRAFERAGSEEETQRG